MHLSICLSAQENYLISLSNGNNVHARISQSGLRSKIHIYITMYACMPVYGRVCLSGRGAGSHESHYIIAYKLDVAKWGQWTPRLDTTQLQLCIYVQLLAWIQAHTYMYVHKCVCEVLSMKSQLSLLLPLYCCSIANALNSAKAIEITRIRAM